LTYISGRKWTSCRRPLLVSAGFALGPLSPLVPISQILRSLTDQTPANFPTEGKTLSTDTNRDSFQSIFSDAVATHLDTSIELETEPEQTIPGSLIDEAALEAISQLILVRTRIKGDIWHLFHQFPISLHHGLHQPFAHALSAAIFLTDVNDRQAVTEILARQNVSYDAKLISKSEWILMRVHHHVPPPEILFSRVTVVVKTYGPLKDATTGQSLFNDKAWDVTKNILEHILNGYYSDPPDVPLYFEIGQDKDGLALYHCCHGTNDVEGVFIKI